MNQEIAQSSPNNGASNATDFQPTTRNPQSAPSFNTQQQSGLQGVTNPQEFLHDTQNVKIGVTSEPAPAQAQVRPTNDATGLALIAAIAIVTAAVLLKISNKLPSSRKSEVVDSNPEESADVQAKTVTKPAATANKKPAKKRKNKTKRRNR